MKKMLVIALGLLLFASISEAAVRLKAIGNTADAAITVNPGWLTGIIVNTDGTNSVTITVYDNATAASGDQLFSAIVVTTSAANRATAIAFGDYECPFFSGMYVDITTSGTVTYDVYWTGL